MKPARDVIAVTMATWSQSKVQPGSLADAVLSALDAAGYAVVPRAVTKAMAEAGRDAADNTMDSDWDSGNGDGSHSYTYLRSDAPAAIFAAMLAVAEVEAKGGE